MNIFSAKATKIICSSGISLALMCADLPVARAAPVVTFGFSTSATGTEDFTSAVGTNGNDNSADNNIVRTYDAITYAWDYGVNRDDVINGVFSATISADQEWINLPPACKTGSSIVDNSNGSQTLTCNVGTITKGSTGRLEASARIIGQRRSPDDTFVGNGQIAEASGTFNGDNITLQTDGNNPVETIISATPKADLRKPRAFVLGLRQDPNGVDGIVVRYPVNILIADGKGSEALDPPGGLITITDDLSGMVPGTKLYDWGTGSDVGGCGWLGEPGKPRLRYGGFPWGRINTGQPDNESVTNSGDWNCQQTTSNEITIEIQNADTTGNHIPDTAYNGTALSADDRYLVSGIIKLWVPVQPILADPNGSKEITNCLSDLNLPGVSGQLNQDATIPPNIGAANSNITNNCYAFTLVAGRGSFNNYYIESVDERTTVLFPMTARNSGDGVVMPTQNYAKRLYARNSGVLDWTNYIYCEKFDNQTQKLEPLPGDPRTAVKTYNSNTLQASEYAIEYGTGDYANSTAQRNATCEDGDSPNGWFTDLTNPPAGVSTDDITKIRFRMLPNQMVEPDEIMDLVVNFTARNTVPGTTDKIPNGTILSNNSAYHIDQLRNGNWFVSSYNPQNHSGGLAYGDRLSLTRAIARLNKETTPDDNEVTSISVGESVKFKLLPTLTATVEPPPVTPVVKVIDRLPQYLTYVNNSANIAPTSIVNNPDNTTTLEWDLGTQTPNQTLPEITFEATADLDTPNDSSAINTGIVESPDDVSSEAARSDFRTVIIGNLAAFRIFKRTQESAILPNGELTYYLNFANTGSSDLGTGEFIDILPHANDGRVPPTNFAGDFEVLDVEGTNGETFEYTTKNHLDINLDPNHPSHKSYGEALLPGDTLWCSEAQFGNPGCPPNQSSFEDVTAIRIFTPDFPQATPTRRITVVMDTENNEPDNAYTNEFSGRVVGLIGFLTSPATSVTVNTPANLVLVKRITAINRGLDNEQLFDNVYVDDSDTKDNESGWSEPIDSSSGVSTYLSGVENAPVLPGDEVEYTIYFLANGDYDVSNATICDVLMQNNDIGEFVENGYGIGRGLALHFGDKPVSVNAPFDFVLSNLADGDQGEFILPGFEAPKACNSPVVGGDFTTILPGSQNQSGSLIVNLDKISHLGNNSFDATPPYGMIRFRIKID